MHARLVFGDRRVLMASDWMIGQPYDRMAGFSLSFNLPDRGRREAGVRRDGRGRPVNMPMEKTFWAETFGMLVDRFGTPWMIGGEAAKV